MFRSSRQMPNCSATSCATREPTPPRWPASPAPIRTTCQRAGWLEQELGEVFPPPQAEQAGVTTTPAGTPPGSPATDSVVNGTALGSPAQVWAVGSDGQPAWRPFASLLHFPPAPDGGVPVPVPVRYQPPAPWLAGQHLGGGSYELDDGQETRLHGYVLEVTRSGLWLRDASSGLDPLSGDDPRLAGLARTVRLLPLDPDAVNVVAAAPGQFVSDPAWAVLNDVLSQLPPEARSRIRLLVPSPDLDGRWAGASRLAAALGPAATVHHLTAAGYLASPTTPVDFASTAADPTVRSGLTAAQQDQLARQRPRYRTSTEDLYRLDGRPPQEVQRDGLLPRPEARTGVARHFDIQGHIAGWWTNAFVSLTRSADFAAHHATGIGENYRYLYRIDGTRARGGIDVNATPGLQIDLPNQQEILFVGGVDARLIVEVWELVAEADDTVTLRPVPWGVPSPQMQSRPPGP